MSEPAPRERVAVLSPHADDAILSLGAMLAGWARAGTRVDVVTVFGGDPESDAAPSEWDANAGFGTHGAAVRRRQDEDRAACGVVGATPRWLGLPGGRYEPVSRVELCEVLVKVCTGADLVLMPGFPLVHDDHREVALAAASGVGNARLGLYVEQPYAMRAFRNERALEIPAPLRDVVRASPAFEWQRTRRRDRLVKWRAIGCYRTQLPMLGGLVGNAGGSAARIRLAVVRAGEAIAWL